MEIYPLDLAIHVVNIIVLYVLLRLLLFKPVKKYMEKRQEKIDTQMTEAAAAKKDAEKIKAEYDDKLANAKAECESILADGYKQRAMDAAKDELTDIAVDMAGRVLRFDEETKHRIAAGEKTIKGTQTGILKLAMETSEQEIVSITAKLEAIIGTKLKLTTEIDDSLIGGYAAYVGGKVYDFSYAAQLNSMKRKLS